MKTSIVILGISQENAERKLNELFEGKEDLIIKRTEDTIETGFEHYRAFKWSQNANGIRAHELYVDEMLNYDEYNIQILPCLIRENNVDYYWEDHVHFFYYGEE